MSDEGRDDLEPDNGTLVFPEVKNNVIYCISCIYISIAFQNVTEQVIRLIAINDNLPEPSESFTVSLLSASNGGRLSAPFSASIVISASDDPMGVLGLATYPIGIVVNEGDDLNAMLVGSNTT